MNLQIKLCTTYINSKIIIFNMLLPSASCLLLILALSSQVLAADSQPHRPFPKKLWTYWEKGLENAPIFVKFSIKNMAHFTKISGWQFTVLDSTSIVNYLSAQSYQKLNFILQKQKKRFKTLPPQTSADLIRILVVYEHGGMWVDATTLFTRNFSWVENLGNDPNLQNKVVDEPEILMYTNELFFGGNKSFSYDRQRKMFVNLFPATQFWAFLSKPKALIFKQLIDENMYIFNKQNLEDYYTQTQKQGYQYRIQMVPYYIYTIYPLQTLLQRKQRQIDANPSNFTYKYAVQYYSMWNFDGLQTAYLFFEEYYWSREQIMRAFFETSAEEFLKKYQKSVYFLKFTGYYRNPMNGILSQSTSEICYNAVEHFPQSSAAEQLLLKYNSLSFAGNPIDCGDVARNFMSNIWLGLGVFVILVLLIMIKMSVWLVKKMKLMINPKFAQLGDNQKPVS